tara:strand:- start:503 stop:736 length:234 start_codon:yes stop_codon:yes gene_type:complete
MDEKKFLQIASKAIGSKISTKSTVNNTEKWDSLGQLQLLATLDKYTKGKTSKINSLTNADSIKKIINILKKNNILKH